MRLATCLNGGENAGFYHGRIGLQWSSHMKKHPPSQRRAPLTWGTAFCACGRQCALKSKVECHRTWVMRGQRPSDCQQPWGIELPHAPRNSIIQHAHSPHSPSRGHPGFLVSLHGEPHKAHGAFCRNWSTGRSTIPQHPRWQRGILTN